MRETTLQHQINEISENVLEELSKRIDPRMFDNIFASGGLELKSLANGKATFVASSETSATLIKSGFLSELRDSLEVVTEGDFEIEITDKSSFARRKEAIEKADVHFFKNSHLSSNFTFDCFVTGPCNKAAYQAALFATLNPGASNPIFIYANSGMGKTHLLQAIGNEYQNKNPDHHVLYISAEEFVDEFVKYATGSKESESLKDFFSTVDLLLVDDIQLLADKDATQVMFFTVFNLLVNQHKQIVLTSDKAPGELRGLQDRLVSRFSGGLSIGITNPDKQTLIEILKMKIRANNLSTDFFEPQVLEYLALNYSKNVRVLEGAFTKLIFMMTIQKQTDKVTLGFVKSVFEDDEVRKAKKGKVDINAIIDTVSEYYSLTSAQLKSKVRTSQIALARQIAMYLARALLKIPYQEIGRAFGKDHTTVLANVQKIEGMLKVDPNIKKAINELTNRVNSSK